MKLTSLIIACIFAMYFPVRVLALTPSPTKNPSSQVASPSQVISDTVRQNSLFLSAGETYNTLLQIINLYVLRLTQIQNKISTRLARLYETEKTGRNEKQVKDLVDNDIALQNEIKAIQKNWEMTINSSNVFTEGENVRDNYAVFRTQVIKLKDNLSKFLAKEQLLIEKMKQVASTSALVSETR